MLDWVQDSGVAIERDERVTEQLERGDEATRGVDEVAPTACAVQPPRHSVVANRTGLNVSYSLQRRPLS